MPFVLQLTDSQDCDFEATGGVDKKGKPAPLDGPLTYTSSDESKVTLVVDANNPNKVTMHAVGDLTASGETVVVSMDGDAKLGPEVKPIHDEIAITIVAGDAVAIQGTLGTPTEQA